LTALLSSLLTALARLLIRLLLLSAGVLSPATLLTTLAALLVLLFRHKRAFPSSISNTPNFCFQQYSL
jgi:hypothetical protein